MATPESEETENESDWDIDYDLIEEASLVQTNKRVEKKTKKTRDNLSHRGSARSLAKSGNGSGKGKRDTSGKHGRQDLVKRHRNAQRVSKELGTILDVVFDYGLTPQGADDAASDRTELMTTASSRTEYSEIDGDALFSEVVAEEMADLIIDESSEADWDQSRDAALGEVCAQFRKPTQPDGSQIPFHVQELCKKGEDCKERLLRLFSQLDVSVWNKALLKAMRESLMVMSEVANEIRATRHEDMSDVSCVSCASSASSLAAQENQITIGLLSVLQAVYTQVTACCTTLLWTMEGWFRQEADFECLAKEGFQYVLLTVGLMKQLIGFEVQMCGHRAGPGVMMYEEAIQKKEDQLTNLMTTLHSCVDRIQESILSPHNTKPGTEEELMERKKLSGVLQKCWEQLKEVTYRVASTHPHLKQELYTSLMLTLNGGVGWLIAIQDNAETQLVIKRMARVITPYREETENGLTDREITAQEWLLPCLQKLHRLTRDLLKQLHKSRSFKKTFCETETMSQIEQGFRKLILVSLARMIRVTQNSEPLDLNQVQKRRDQGLEMMHLLERYDKGYLSIDFERDAAEYAVFRSLKNAIVDNVLELERKVRPCKMTLAGRQGSLSSSGEIPVDQLKDVGGCSQFPHTALSESTQASTRIGTLPDSREDQEEGVQYTESANICMPHPFRDAIPDMEWPSMDEFLMPADSDCHEGHPNPLSCGRSVELPGDLDLQAHPLSDLAGSSLTIDSCQLENDVADRDVSRFYMISKDELVCDKHMGSGSTAQVFKMHYHGNPVAVKIMNYPYLFDTEERLVHECEMHLRLAHHPNIVQFFGQSVGVRDVERAVGLVMELCEIGSLYNVIQDARGIGVAVAEGIDICRYEKYPACFFYKIWPLRLRIACDVASGMEYLHSKEIVHRDLTSYNVVLSHGGRDGAVFKAKVCDFERSHHIPSGKTIPRSNTMPNSVGWASPEVIRSHDYCIKADVFSIGVILWEIIHLDVPWRGRSADETISLVKSGERLAMLEECPTDLPEYPKLVALIQDCWEEDPKERPTMREFHKRLYSILEELVARLKKQSPGPAH